MWLTEEVPAGNHDSWLESEREFQEETLDDLVRSCGPIGFDSLDDLSARQHRVSVSSRGSYG